ncbi:MAG TPA: DUF1223 domain-containing protein [Sphingomonas sp.]|nr:DUF1223 domain-containing protein [Sphingomonas sp.]
MTRFHLLPLFAPLVLAACQQGAAIPAKQSTAATTAALDPAHPVVLELYQSQGCSSCPPALAVLDKEADRPGVLALNFAVTYWDQLGWKDQFAKPEFTARQWDYSHAQGRDQVATPTTIIDGRVAVIGSSQVRVEAALAATHHAAEPAIAATNGKLSIGALPKLSGTVWVADYDPRRVPVAINAGENGGRTLIHRNIVKSLVRLGEWHGVAASFALPQRGAGLDRAALIQNGPGGPIVAARRL